jgi:predicted lipoprotein
MSTRATLPATKRGPSRGLVIGVAAAIVLVGAMALDTKVVRIDSATSVAPGTFSAADYGATQFPIVQASIERRAVSAATIASAVASNRAAAAKKYGVDTGAGAEIPVKFTALVGKGDFGTYDVTIDGVPKAIAVQLQTGPAITGTDLRDATGTITFGQFTNQIDYQNAGSALNKQMKKDVLAKLDTSNLTGKKIAVVGVFLLSDASAHSWLVTPVKLELQ